MPRTKEERIDTTLLAGSDTTLHVARTFNTTYRTQITRDTVAKLIMKFKRSGSVADASRSGRPKTAVDEGRTTMTNMPLWQNLSRNSKGQVPSPMQADLEDQRWQQMKVSQRMKEAAMVKSLIKGSRRLSVQMGISQSSVMRILRDNKWHPYKLQMLQ
ncbi:hypothetical protein AVEN_31398-1 [Araneus ventricosus]|uniref:DUF4817 domain-containing protein n=1 Tax=Araneus ventricosus TaxID=182803 RepID=A0A4Y2F6Y4_ARAVE|nr:hypothetical protein AVEN_31398-1 [Araneus ventricosus]